MLVKGQEYGYITATKECKNMSQHAGLAQRAANDTGYGEAAEPPVRPKVMRRPSHFSSKDAPAPHTPAFLSEKHDSTPDLSQPAPSMPVVPYTPTAKAWQDDARFGAVMLAVVVLVNVGLMLWLPHIRPTPSVVQGALITREIENETVQPDVPASPVTLYTKPVTQTEAPVVHVLGDDQ